MGPRADRFARNICRPGAPRRRGSSLPHTAAMLNAAIPNTWRPLETGFRPRDSHTGTGTPATLSSMAMCSSARSRRDGLEVEGFGQGQPPDAAMNSRMLARRLSGLALCHAIGCSPSLGLLHRRPLVPHPYCRSVGPRLQWGNLSDMPTGRPQSFLLRSTGSCSSGHDVSTRVIVSPSPARFRCAPRLVLGEQRAATSVSGRALGDAARTHTAVPVSPNRVAAACGYS